MYSRLALFPLLFLTVAFQAPNDSIQRHYKAAQDFYGAGKLDEAEAEYKAALGEGYRNLGKVLLAVGEYDGAIKGLDRAVTSGGDFETILIEQATAYFYLQQYAKAIDPLKKALAANVRSSAANHLLGKVYFMLGELDKAASHLEIALKLARGDFDISYTLALAHLTLKHL